MKVNKRNNESNTRWIKKDSTQAVLMLAPMLVGFLLFTYVPILYILRYAFYNSNGFRETFIGMANFSRLFSDSAYWNSILNTFILTFGKLAVEIPLAQIGRASCRERV